jgi:hypothetical protein
VDELTTYDHIQNMLMEWQFEDRSKFNTGEIIHEGKIYPSINAVYDEMKRRAA